MNGGSIYSEGPQIIITSDIPIEKSISFNNVTFEKEVIFKDLEIKGWIEFINCIFHYNVSFISCCIEISKQFNPKEPISVLFSNCHFSAHNLNIEETETESGFKIKHTTDLHDLSIRSSKLDKLNIESVTLNKVNFYNNSFLSELRFENCTVNSLLRQESNSYSSLVFLKSKFLKNLFLKDNEIYLGLTFQECEFIDTINIDPFQDIKQDSKLNLIDNIFNKKITISYYKRINQNIWSGGCDEIFIFANKFNDGIYISGCDEGQITRINKISLDFSSTFEGFLKISNFKTMYLLTTGENYKGNVILNFIEANDFSIEAFANYSTFQLIKCRSFEKNSQFKILESYLEKFQFTNCDLASFEKFDFRSSNLSMIKSSSTLWFNYKQLENTIITNRPKNTPLLENGKYKIKKHNESVYLQLRDVFRQLKYAMEQQGDKVNALTFKSYEMKAHHNYLKTSKSWYDKDRISLLLGKTNSFGINWYLPLIFLFGFTILFHTFLLFDESPKYFCFGNTFLPKDFLFDLWNTKSTFIKLLNPLLKMEDLFEVTDYKASGFTHLSYFSYKIIYSFFIFQLISAFRKFVKN